MDADFLPSIYGEVWYNGHQTKHKGFLSDYVTYLIGSPRIRQVRVVPCKCSFFFCGNRSHFEIDNSALPLWILEIQNSSR